MGRMGVYVLLRGIRHKRHAQSKFAQIPNMSAAAPAATPPPVAPLDNAAALREADEKLKRLVCKIVEDSGADFIKTSTGYAPGGATAKDVELFRDLLPESVGVDASGGIDTAEDAELMINAGAARIGTSHAVDIIKEFSADRD